MIFGFGKKKNQDADDEPRQEFELISFKGPLHGNPPNLKQNPGLVKAGLVAAKEVISDAISRRAGTLRFDPKGDRYVGMMLVDGMPFAGPRLPKQQGLAVTQILKLLAGLNIQVRNKNQRGGIKADLEGVPYEIVVEVTPVQGGERLTVHMDNVKIRPSKPDDIGLPEIVKDKVREASSSKKGVLLACGPPRSGVTTSAIGLVRSVDAYMYSIYTLFDTGSWDLPYVTNFTDQTEGENIATTIVRCQRKEGEVLYCPPIESAEDAKMLFEGSEASSIISEFPARDTASGLTQLIEWCGAELVANQLSGLLSQKLIRKLCDSCKEAYPPNPKLIQKLGLGKETKALYRHRTPPQEPQQRGQEWTPCHVCGDLGYFGRTAMFEFLEMTSAMRELVKSGPDADAIRLQMKKEGMLTLQQDGLRLVANGHTSLEELQRNFKG